MKNAFFLLLSFVVLTASTTINESNNPAITYDLATALSAKKIALQVSGSEDSPHYYQPLVVNLKNLTQAPLVIQIKNGQLFKSNDPEIQDIIVTQEELIALEANESKSLPIFGMCVQQQNAGPGTDQKYTLDALATGELATLAKRIQDQKAFSIAAQQSIWAITDGIPLAEIDSYNADDANELRDYVADLLNVPDTVVVRGETITLDSGQKTIKRSVEGNFKYKFSKTSNVVIGMFNEQNIVVKELYSNPETPAGEHELSYEFDTMVFPDETYYVRLIVDGQIKINFKMKARRS